MNTKQEQDGKKLAGTALPRQNRKADLALRNHGRVGPLTEDVLELARRLG